MPDNFTPIKQQASDWYAKFQVQQQQSQSNPPPQPPSQADAPPSDSKKPSKQATDGIFIIKAEIWESLYDHVQNDYELSDNFSLAILLTYLVLASGTGKDNVTSSWSSGSVYRYAGISPKLADKAIKWLSKSGYLTIVKQPEKNKSPIYKLTVDSEYEFDLFLPNGLVTGVAGEKTALKRLYDEGNIHLLYLFIRLYGFQDKELDVIDPNIVSHSLLTVGDSDYEQPDIDDHYNESNLVVLWVTYERYSMMSYYKDSDFHHFSQEPEFHHQPTNEQGMFGFLNTLESLGLIRVVHYACRGKELSPPDEIDFICQLDTKEQKHFLAQLMSISANKEGNYLEGFTDDDVKSVILPSNIKQFHISSFYQLRYRTKTGASSIMYAKQSQLNRQISQLFKKLENG